MRRITEKLMAILLTLLLGLSPLQGAIAGFSSSLDQEEGVHQMLDSHGGMVMNSDHGAPDCVQCLAGDGCNDHGCSSGQCASCALAMLPYITLPESLTAVTELFRTDDGSVNQFSSFLFRPPRV